MALDVVDTISSTFDRLASKASIGVVGFAVLLILVVMGGASATGAAFTISPILAVLVGGGTLLAYLAGVVALFVGGFRAFDQKDIQREMFTENLFWPFLRMTGSNIILQTFLTMAIYLIMIPVMFAGIGVSGLMDFGPETMIGLEASSTYLLIGGGALVAAVALYVVSALAISLPRIAISDKRLFQSLDESVQVTKGSRPRIIVAILPFAALIGVGVGLEMVLGGVIGALSILFFSIVGSLYWIALLAELNSRL